MYESIDCCRLCGAGSLRDLICFGDQPLANSLKKSKDEDENKIPLTLSFCNTSNHIQLKETVNKELLFSDYIWVTGTASSTKRFAKEFAQRVIQIASPQKTDLVLEIASNDGTFLIPFKDQGYSNVLGVDPATNLQALAKKSGIETFTAFWNSEVSEEIIKKYGRSKIVIARNVLPHVSQINEVISGISTALREDGVAVIEFHYAGTILKELHYDSVYHEHLHYFSLNSVIKLFEQYSLFPFHADPSPISGGGYVLYLSPKKRDQSAELTRFMEREVTENVNSLSSWMEFARRCIEHKRLSREMLSEFDGKKVIGFGASARSSTYLNFCEFSNQNIEAIIDNNSMKHGQFTPGSSIPIVSFDEGLHREPDIILVLAWNFKDEIIQMCRSNGYSGRFIIPFPGEPRIVL